tara:strand:+ start:113 stop:421 length:309 start_codon:yes stop_codon:yes gene_type:complete
MDLYLYNFFGYKTNYILNIMAIKIQKAYRNYKYYKKYIFLKNFKLITYNNNKISYFYKNSNYNNNINDSNIDDSNIDDNIEELEYWKNMRYNIKNQNNWIFI